jgi:HEPN domain-containing protein
MSDPEPAEWVQSWLERARSDLNLGRTALRAKGVLPEDACYHAQQCAEKALKSLLTHQGIPFPRTHVIEVLLDLLRANQIDIPVNVDNAYELTQYAVQTRYPGDWEPVMKKEARQALERAALVLAWVESQVP